MASWWSLNEPSSPAMDSERGVAQVGLCSGPAGHFRYSGFLGYDDFQNINRIQISNGFQYLENTSKGPVVHKGKMNL